MAERMSLLDPILASQSPRPADASSGPPRAQAAPPRADRPAKRPQPSSPSLDVLQAHQSDAPCHCGSSDQWRPKAATSAPWKCLACQPPQSTTLPMDRRTTSQETATVAEGPHSDIDGRAITAATGVVAFAQAMVPWCTECSSSVGRETPEGCFCYCCGAKLPSWPDPQTVDPSVQRYSQRTDT